MAQFQFHNHMVEGDMLEFTPVPPGRYTAMIDKTEIGAPNEKGTVQLMTEWVIIDGQHKARQVRNYTPLDCPRHLPPRHLPHRRWPGRHSPPRRRHQPATCRPGRASRGATTSGRARPPSG